MNSFFAGARLLSADEAQDVDLGALKQLQGTWTNAPVSPDLIAQGWNVISVPGVTSDFVFEVIPYTETFIFSPVVLAGNRGPVVNGNQVQQQITGLLYQQTIVSACPGGSAACNERGFPYGTELHLETGFFLNVMNPNGGFDVARISTIPHGNSLLALGHSSTRQNPGNDFIPISSAAPANLDGSPLSILGYTDPVTRNMQFPGIFNQSDPNSFLTKALSGQKITDMTTIVMSTTNKNAGSGILNIPFIASNVDATSLDAIFWIETIQGSPALQMQYTQTINIVFPPTRQSLPVVWPHITVNTLVKQPNLNS